MTTRSKASKHPITTRRSWFGTGKGRQLVITVRDWYDFDRVRSVLPPMWGLSAAPAGAAERVLGVELAALVAQEAARGRQPQVAIDPAAFSRLPG